MNRSVILLEGLDCPNCAEKIANEVRKSQGISAADMDFINKKLYVSYDTAEAKMLSLVEKIVKSHEPDVNVSIAEKGKKADTSDHKFDIIKIAVAVVLFGVTFFVDGLAGKIIIVAAYLIAGYEVLFEAARNIVKGRPFDENFLMSVASIGAMFIGEMSEGAAVMIFYQIGELFQTIAVERSRKSITSLMELKPEFANIKVGDEVKKVAPEEVKKGDIILVKPGERVPLDGIIVKGETSFDTSALTGESIPLEARADDAVLSGSINLNAVVEICVTESYSNSTVAKLLDMVENSTAKKAQTEKFITRFARVYTPAVVAAALLLGLVPPMIAGFTGFGKWIYRALVFLVISCPCALVISVPLSFFAGIGGASRRGILIKGAVSLEALSNCKTVAFDKTGTVTKGVFKVQSVQPNGITDDVLLAYAAAAESNSNHPIARSIVEAYKAKLPFQAEYLQEAPGYGVKAVIDGKNVICGNLAMLEKEGVSVPQLKEEILTAVYVAVNNSYSGRILLGDEIKETSADGVRKLRESGIKQTVMLTGDKKAIADEIGKQVGIDTVKAQLLPQDKVTAVEELISAGNGTVAFAGDGINDAPVIARADVGIAMGGLGSDAAIEAADIVLMNDDISKLSDAVRISKKTMSIVRQNIAFALGVKAVILVLGAFGFAGMWAAVFADVGVSLIAILNALRAMKVKA